jgi:hypothetical protein
MTENLRNPISGINRAIAFRCIFGSHRSEISKGRLSARRNFRLFAIVGLLVVIGAIIGAYLMEYGNLKVLMQPAELIIIGGAASGTVLIANPIIF